MRSRHDDRLAFAVGRDACLPVSDNLRAVLGPTAAGAEVTIALPTADELLAEVLSLRVQDDAASAVLSVDRLGDGYRSLLRLGIGIGAEVVAVEVE